MNKIFCIIAVCLLMAIGSNAQTTMTVTHRYLNLPVSGQAGTDSLTMRMDGQLFRRVAARLSTTPEYWVFVDMEGYVGRRLTLEYPANATVLKMVSMTDQPAGAESFYKEPLRPQLHFTSRRGWINDPNGLVWHDGEFHLFYQHNPYEREWGNMHWGHAVSSDLIHWQELPTALFPDELGFQFSGSVVIDSLNTAGFGTEAMVAVYTADSPGREVQCLAYSMDKGRTWTKYGGNPVIDSGQKWQTVDTRDPKVFWYEPQKVWVMALCERDGHSIYQSKDLKHWEFKSHVVGFWECPELFELPVDGDNSNKLWVMYGASGTYMLGHFDGAVFTPVSGKQASWFGAIYAAQTFNNMPDERRIQIGWDRIDHPNMPFKGQMSLPAELSLRTTPCGIRLFCNPIREIENLQQRVVSRQNLTAEQADVLLAPYKNADALRIKAVISFTHSTPLGLDWGSMHVIDCDLNFNLVNGFFYGDRDFENHRVTADIIIDKTSVQVYLDGGALSYCLQRNRQNTDFGQGFHFWGHKDIAIEQLDVFMMSNMWNK